VAWNFRRRPVDYGYVECERYREALSARLDGEDRPAERAAVDAHLTGCPACRRWYDDAAAVTRLVRVRPVTANPAPEVKARPPVRPTRRYRLAAVLRVLLGVLGLAQFVLGMAQVGAVATGAHAHGSGQPGAALTAGHLWHESAAWNVAIGAGFAWIALRRVRPAGALPMLTAFVALLGLLSAGDIAAGMVDALRLLSHGFVLAGYLIVVALSHPRLDLGPPAGRRGRRWSARATPYRGGEPAVDPPVLRLLPGQARARSRRRAA
jgi:predicted anti-sigma-YlaC factor YlaD